MSGNKTHWKKAFKSDYLSSSDIDDGNLILTIKNVKYEECKTQSGTKFCNVAHFVESGVKPMILNVGNSKIVKKIADGNFKNLIENRKHLVAFHSNGTLEIDRASGTPMKTTVKSTINAGGQEMKVNVEILMSY